MIVITSATCDRSPKQTYTAAALLYEYKRAAREPAAAEKPNPQSGNVQKPESLHTYMYIRKYFVQTIYASNILY